MLRDKNVYFFSINLSTTHVDIGTENFLTPISKKNLSKNGLGSPRRTTTRMDLQPIDPLTAGIEGGGQPPHRDPDKPEVSIEEEEGMFEAEPGSDT